VSMDWIQIYYTVMAVIMCLSVCIVPNRINVLSVFLAIPVAGRIYGWW
jgi:hypothetical protein